MKHLHFGVNFGIERERCLSIEWVWSIRANAGCHEHRRSKFALMNIQISKCDPYREKFLLTERVIQLPRVPVCHQRGMCTSQWDRQCVSLTTLICAMQFVLLCNRLGHSIFNK